MRGFGCDGRVARKVEGKSGGVITGVRSILDWLMKKHISMT